MSANIIGAFRVVEIRTRSCSLRCCEAAQTLIAHFNLTKVLPGRRATRRPSYGAD